MQHAKKAYWKMKAFEAKQGKALIFVCVFRNGCLVKYEKETKLERRIMILLFENLETECLNDVGIFFYIDIEQRERE